MLVAAVASVDGADGADGAAGGSEIASRLARAIEALDAANAEDPMRVEFDGELRPKELAHAELATRWVRRLRPDAGEELLLAARGHHLRRWAVPRSALSRGARRLPSLAC